MDTMTDKTTIRNAMGRLTEGGTYTFEQLQALVGRRLADHVRGLAGVPVQTRPKPRPETVETAVTKKPRAPRKRAQATVKAPARRGSGSRLGDRLSPQ